MLVLLDNQHRLIVTGRHDSPDLSPQRAKDGKGRHDSPDLSPPRRKGRHDSPDQSPPRRKGTP